MNFNIERLSRQKEEIENLIKMYQGSQQNPVNNFINSGLGNKDLIEWRILNENEEVDNLYVNNKTLFINDNLMVLKGVDGSLEKWKIEKIYPIDKKDEKINELMLKIEELERRLNNEHTKSISTVGECDKSNDNDDEYIKSKSKANVKYIQRKEQSGAGTNDSGLL